MGGACGAERSGCCRVVALAHAVPSADNRRPATVQTCVSVYALVHVAAGAAAEEGPQPEAASLLLHPAGSGGRGGGWRRCQPWAALRGTRLRLAS